MMLRPLKTAFLLALLLALSCPAHGADRHDPAIIRKARNIVLLIGDGMGAEHRNAARRSAGGQLRMDTLPAQGMLTTCSPDGGIADSAAAATALSAGVKTKNGVLALDADLKPVKTILEQAQALGKSVGLVTTTQVTHATPAAFAVHHSDRYRAKEIAGQMLEARPDVLLGGGEAAFLPDSTTGCDRRPGERTDGRNLLHEAAGLGYTVVCGREDFIGVSPLSTTRLIGLFSGAGMARPFSPSLAEMTRKAIDLLSRNRKGFFLMVEAGQIDWASHDNDAGHAVQDTLQLDEAVGTALEFALREKETLLIVTADHETGGMSVSLRPTGAAGEDGPFATPEGAAYYVNWATTAHTGLNVPVSAQGPLAERLNGTNDNTLVHAVMLGALQGM